MERKQINWQTVLISFLVSSSLFYFVSCQKDEIPGRGRIGSKGGKIISLDGKINLTIPANSLSNSIEFHIIESPDEDTYSIDGNRIGKKYSIEPYDLELANPATIEINYESEISKICIPANLGVLQLGTFDDRVINNISVSNDLESKTLSFTLNRLSKLRLVEFNNQNALFNFYWSIPVIKWYMETPSGKSYLNEISIQKALSLWEHETSSFKFERTSVKASANIIFTEIYDTEGFTDKETNYHIHEETAGMMCFYFNFDLYNKTKLADKDHVDIYIASDDIKTSDEAESLNVAERIITHEIGHALGLAHSVNSSPVFNIMNESVNTVEFWDGNLNSNDKNALHENYTFNQSNLGELKIETLVDFLEYPNAIFLANNKVYYTESAKRNTSYGGRSSLNFYDLMTNKITILHPYIDCTDAMVVVGEKIYLSSFLLSIPGESGFMAVFDISQNKLTYLPEIEIATTDMCLGSDGNIYLLGNSRKTSGKSLLKFPSPDYTSPVVVFTGLGPTFSMATIDNEIYYSGFLGTLTNSVYYVGSWGIWKIENYKKKTFFFKANFFSGMALSDNYIYYSDSQNMKIGRINRQTKVAETLFDNIPYPAKMVFDKENNTLYVLTHGTSELKFKDGKVLKIANIE